MSFGEGDRFRDRRRAGEGLRKSERLGDRLGEAVGMSDGARGIALGSRVGF